MLLTYHKYTLPDSLPYLRIDLATLFQRHCWWLHLSILRNRLNIFLLIRLHPTHTLFGVPTSLY